MSGLTALLGETLTSKNGPAQVCSLAKAGHVVGLYFTKRRCSDCREFMSQVKQWYKDIREGDVGTKLEIVYIYSKESQKEFDEYYGEMPWTALPYTPTGAEAMKLHKKFRVTDTPKLVFLEADTGKVINKNGWHFVDRYKPGENIPRMPKMLCDILTGPVLSKSGEVDLKDARKGKVLGIYFSAEWCGPCGYFTPKFLESYNNLKKAGKDFEVVFVSWDNDEKEFEDYCNDMPWLAFPLDDDRAVDLGEKFDVCGVPTLIILDENLELLTDQGTRTTSAMLKSEGQTFVPPPLLELSEIHGGYDSKTLVFFTDGKDDLIAQAQSLMQEVADETAAATKASQGTDNELGPILMIYEDKDGDGHVPSLREYIHVQTPAPCLVYINMDKQRKHVIDKPADLTKEDFRKMVSKIRDGTIKTAPFTWFNCRLPCCPCPIR